MREVNYIFTHTDNNWHIKNYLIKADTNEIVDNSFLKPAISNLLNKISTHFLSVEFNYWKIGFSIIHFGNRGINISIWHWGNWGQTVELFGQHWYSYGRDLSKLEELDSVEPVLCSYEIDLFTSELSRLRNLSLTTDSFDEIIDKYKLSR